MSIKQGKIHRVWVAVVILAASVPIRADIAGSVHDFSGNGWSGGQICNVCHTPRNTDTGVVDAPLWNHQLSTTSYTMYDSPALTVRPQSQPQGTSKLCLSCHDGTLALDSFSSRYGAAAIRGKANLASDLRDDHPVSIKWDHRNQLSNCANCHFARDQPLSGPLPFFNGYIECATCHDVHNKIAKPALLRLPLQGSQLCFHCHGK